MLSCIPRKECFSTILYIKTLNLEQKKSFSHDYADLLNKVVCYLKKGVFPYDFVYQNIESLSKE